MITRLPDKLTVQYDGGTFTTVDSGSFDDVAVRAVLADDSVKVYIKADTTPLRYITLHWYFRADEKRTDGVRILGDAWERGYGDLEWRGVVHERYMPWYILVSNGTDLNRDFTGRKTEGFGVKVRPNSICSWHYNSGEVTLTMDIRNGGSGVILGGRELEAGEILFRTYENCSAFDAGIPHCRYRYGIQGCP